MDEAMKTQAVRLSLLLAFACVLLVWPRSTPSSEPGIPFDAQGRPTYVPGEVLVGLKAGLPMSAMGGASRSLMGSTRELRALRRAPGGPSVQRVKLQPGVGVGQAILALQQDPAVEYAEPNYLSYPFATPTDALYAEQWGLKNTNQTYANPGSYPSLPYPTNNPPGFSGSDINVEPVWDASVNGSGIIVAVIDTGVDYSSTQLAANMWDGAGGANCPGGGSPSINHGCDFADGDNDPYPINEAHGSHVAGIVAAVRDDINGVVGVAYNAQIMALKVFPDLGGGATDGDIASAIVYAADNGAQVMNLSLGRGGSASFTLTNAISHAVLTKGSLLVVAAGNSNTNNDFSASWPANYAADPTLGQGVISVLASDQADVRASFSNYGATTVNIAAPGTNILSTVWSRVVVQQELGATASTADCATNSTTCFDSTIYDGNPSADCVAGSGSCEWGGIKSGTYYILGDVSPPGGVGYADNIDGTITTQAVSTSGASKVVLRYYAAWDTECNNDYVDVEVKNAVGTWIKLDATDFNAASSASLCATPSAHTHMGRMGSVYGGFVAFSHDISAQASGNTALQVQFRFVTNGSVHSSVVPGGFQVVNVTIDKQDAAPVYDLFMGTSMASPMVAGVAALVREKMIAEGTPDPSPAQIKTRILSTGQVIAGLHCLTSTSKRVDAFAAVQNTTTANPDNSDCAAPVVATAGGGGGGCLITWLTEDYLPRDALQPLREVREWLWQQGPWGRALVRGYYRASAGIVAWLRGVRAATLALPHTAAI
jgi:subtilisin family serine protease